jgi:pilus assembly protein CpaE
MTHWGQESMEEVRILIVDDHPPTIENITRMLQFEQDIRVVGTATTGQEGLDLAKEVDPHVVLMDVSLPDMDGIETAGKMRDFKPFVEVIMLSIDRDFELMTRAMNEGVGHFMLKPPPPDKLLEEIRKAAERREKRKKVTGRLKPPPEMEINHRPKGKIIAVYSGKGGVGRTLLSTNLALLLNTEETPTILVDADLQFGDALVFMNLQRKYSITDIATYVDELDQEILEEVLTVHEQGLKILAAPHSPESASQIKVEALIKILEYVQKQFAYIVVDTASHLDDISLSILELSDLIISIATPDIPSIKNIRTVMNTLYEQGIDREKALLVLNSVERRDRITSERVEEHLKQEIVAELPYDRVSVKRSINRGEPLVLEQKTHPYSRSLLDLVGIVKEKLMIEIEQLA